MNAEPVPSFVRQLSGTFRYPFQGDGPYVLGVGAVFFTMADYVSAYATILGILIQAGLVGYLAAYAKDVVRTSAMNEDYPPHWADFSDWINDLVVPALEMLAAITLSFGPAVFLSFKYPTLASPFSWWGLTAGAWGCFSLPVLFLALAMTDSILALLNPIPLVRAIWVTVPDYLLVCLFCALVFAIEVGLQALLTIANWIPILPHLISRLVSIYLLTVLMRSFGLLYRHHHDRLRWY